MRVVSKFIVGDTFLPRYVDFTVLQLLQRNIQLGASVKFSLLSAHWFICGIRQKFTIIDLNFTVIYYRRFLGLVSVIIVARRHVLFVNEREHIGGAVSSVARSVGEPYVTGRWVGGTLTNFKNMLISYHTSLK